VIAENRYLAEDAVDLIAIDIEQQEPVLDVDAARNGDGPMVHPEIGTNTPQAIPLFGDPDLEQAFGNAAHVVRDTIVMHRYVQAPMECRGIVADWDPYSDELTVWSGTQSVHGVQGLIAGLLGIGTNQIRVVQPDVGGGFGQKMTIMRDEWAVVLAARLLGRPVRWIEDRRENLTAAAHARDERMDLSMALDSDGTITAIRGEYIRRHGCLYRAVSDECVQDSEGRFFESGGVHQYMWQGTVPGPLLDVRSRHRAVDGDSGSPTRCRSP
jgi:carbon-monoxide dehydrogenase large subunit